MTKTAQLLDMARALAESFPAFHAIEGPGDGNRRTNEYVKALNARAVARFGNDFAEQMICNATDLRADYFFEDESTIVEVALGLPNPNTEFEKDILKALVAKDRGARVTQLVFISRAGALAKCAQPGRQAMMEWARRVHQLEVVIFELGGSARKRVRQARLTAEAAASTSPAI